jgi:hypothetical protein
MVKVRGETITRATDGGRSYRVPKSSGTLRPDCGYAALAPVEVVIVLLTTSM